ncbi:hypothetical protein LWI28_022142 [Acer negundo]|uniref:Uncharacterized protein n=1 Tax=Acer negundo TaxID=4023 RepID=A0AAD5NM31_ACENE|nr:hypothetical protein LWI28_022142 [Acer negundo]
MDELLDDDATSSSSGKSQKSLEVNCEESFPVGPLDEVSARSLKVMFNNGRELSDFALEGDEDERSIEPISRM